MGRVDASFRGWIPGVPSLYGRMDQREASVQCIGHGTKDTRKSETGFLISPVGPPPCPVVIARETLPNQIEFGADRKFRPVKPPTGTLPEGWRVYATEPSAAISWLSGIGPALHELPSDLRGQFLFTRDRYGYKETGLMTNQRVRQRFEAAIAAVLQIGAGPG